MVIDPLAPLLRSPWPEPFPFIFARNLRSKTKLTNCVFSFNKYCIFHFVSSERTDFREYRFLLSLLSLKNHQKLKQYAANTLPLFLCYSYLVAKAVNKGVLESRCFKFFLQKFLKSTSEEFPFFIMLQAGGLYFYQKNY